MFARSFLIAFVALVAMASFASAAGNGQLLLQKQVHTEFMQYLPQRTVQVVSLDQEFTVELTLTNVGEGPAFDVLLKDPWNTDNFTVTAGEIETTFESIPAGETRSVNLTLKAGAAGTLNGFRAYVEYKPVAEGQKKFGFSTSMNTLSILPDDVFRKVTSKHTLEWVIFWAGVLTAVVFPLAAYFKLSRETPNGVPKVKSA